MMNEKQSVLHRPARPSPSSQLPLLVLAAVCGWLLHSSFSSSSIQESTFAVIDSVDSFRESFVRDSFTKAKVPVCNRQPEPIFPQLEWNPHLDQNYLDQAAERLGTGE